MSEAPELLRAALREVLAGATLDRERARRVFGAGLDGEADPVLLGGLLTALAGRGETVEEIAGAAEALRERMVPLEHPFEDAVDTCGTGGDGLGSFNLSTAAALVAAAAGARVIKHGNRSVSSRCGSADLLEAAGIPLELGPAAAARVLEEAGITFLYAPAFHPAMRHAAPVRRALGVRTLFNWLGPLCNPGRVRRHLLGVGEASLLEPFAGILEVLGFERALVIHGAGGADELTLAGENRVRAVGEAPAGGWSAAELGLPEAPVEALAGGDAARNLEILQAVLAGEGGPVAEAVVLNAAAALAAAGLEDQPEAACDRAREALDSGRAATILETWRRTACALAGEGA